MHNRDLMWKTSDGRSLKLREITSSQLVNILIHIENNIYAFEQKFGKEKIDFYKKTILQEIRLRKLNRIKIDEENLF